MVAMNVRPLGLRLSVMCICAIWLSACSGSPAPHTSPTAEPSPIPAVNAVSIPMLPTDAAALPDITPQTYDELLTQLHGTPVVVNIWGSWCDPCRREAPLLAETADRFGDSVQFIGIDILDTRVSARGFIEEFGWRYPSFFDPSPGGQVRTSLGYLGQPATIIYGADGAIVADWEGALSPDFLESHLEALTKSPGP